MKLSGAALLPEKGMKSLPGVLRNRIPESRMRHPLPCGGSD